MTAGDADDLQSALDEMAEATDRLLTSVDGLSEQALREPSLLPGWTRGHVLTHVARNADALTNLVLAAVTGDGRPMYPGGPDTREVAIEQGAGRHLGDLRLDLAESADQLLAAFAEFPADAREREVAMRSGATAYGWEIPRIRTREVEIHHVDLAAGPTHADWSPGFAALVLDAMASRPRGPQGLTADPTDLDRAWTYGEGGPVVAGTAADLAWWLTGRGRGDGLTSETGTLPEIGAW